MGEATSTVQVFQRPVTWRDMQAFLGMTGYYRKFVKDYGTLLGH